MIGKYIVLLFLVLGTVWDVKKKSVPNIYLYFFGLVAVAYSVFELINGKGAMDVLTGILPGCIGLFLAFVTKEQIGLADGLVILCAGIFLNLKDVLYMVFSAFVLLTVVSMVLILSRRAGRKTKIPFIPFLLAGQVICIYGGIL